MQSAVYYWIIIIDALMFITLMLKLVKLINLLMQLVIVFLIMILQHNLIVDYILYFVDLQSS